MMRCDYTVFICSKDFYVSVVILVYPYGLSGAFSVDQVSGNDVTVDSIFQTGEQRSIEVELVIVERDKSAFTETKGDLIAAIIPPVVDCGSVDGVAEDHHVVDLTPPVLADPAVAASIVRINDRGQ